MSTLVTPIAPVHTDKPAVNMHCQYVVVNFTKDDNYATARINFLDEDGRIVKAYDVSFSEAELAEWGTDDAFIIHAAKAKLSLQ